MLYCFGRRKYDELENMNDCISEAVRLKSFIYYDKDNDCFKNEDEEIIDINNKNVLVHCFVPETKLLVDKLVENGAIIPNTYEDINKVKKWYEFIDTKRNIVSFNGYMLSNEEFMQKLLIYFGNKDVFFKTVLKDYNGIISMMTLNDKNSSLRKAIEYHRNDLFLVSDKVNIDVDEIGRKEYRCFIFDGDIMNISRVTDNRYHSIPLELIEYVKEILNNIKESFPKTFVLDIFKCEYGYDVLECNPFEDSGTYMYNSIFSISNDLEHKKITNIPEENKNIMKKFSEGDLKPSTLEKINGTFSKDYYDIEHYGDRINGNVFVDGLGDECKLDFNSIMSSFDIISDGDMLNDRNPKKMIFKNDRNERKY